VEGQTIQNSDTRKNTKELINGEEVRVKETVNDDTVSKTFSLCALVSVDMFYTQFILIKTWSEGLSSIESVVPTNWASCNTAKTLRETSVSQN
jgi:hypothetical protein